MLEIIFIIVGILILATLFDKWQKSQTSKNQNVPHSNEPNSVKNESSKTPEDKLESLISLTEKKFEEFKSLDFVNSNNDSLLFRFVTALVCLSMDKHRHQASSYVNYSIRELHNYIEEKSDNSFQYNEERKQNLLEGFRRDKNILKKLLVNIQKPSDGDDRHEYDIEITTEFEMMYQSIFNEYPNREQLTKFKDALSSIYSDVDSKVRTI